MSVLVGVCGRSLVDHVETITFSVIDFVGNATLMVFISPLLSELSFSCLCNPTPELELLVIK